MACPLRREGAAGLTDRSSRPHHGPNRLDTPAEEQSVALRRRRMTGPAIARTLGRPSSTVGVVLRRRALGRLAHKKTRPYTPKTNGKAERFIQSSLRESAYASPFNTSAERQAAMHPWLHNYNTARPHAGKPLISRLTRDNLLGSRPCGRLA